MVSPSKRLEPKRPGYQSRVFSFSLVSLRVNQHWHEHVDVVFGVGETTLLAGLSV